MDVGHVVAVTEGFLVGPFSLVLAAARTQYVGQIAVG